MSENTATIIFMAFAAMISGGAIFGLFVYESHLDSRPIEEVCGEMPYFSFNGEKCILDMNKKMETAQ